MMYDSVDQRNEDMRQFFGSDATSYRMATVMGIEGGRPIIRFYGETVNAQKKYKYLSSYVPVIGDAVLLAHVSRTHVILGKVV